jgi:hypothetical protein
MPTIGRRLRVCSIFVRRRHLHTKIYAAVCGAVAGFLFFGLIYYPSLFILNNNFTTILRKNFYIKKYPTKCLSLRIIYTHIKPKLEMYTHIFRRFFIFSMFFLTMVCHTAHAQKNTYARTKVFFDAAHTPAMLAALGIEADHGHHAEGYLINDFSDVEIQSIKQVGFHYNILIADVQAHYANQNQNTSEKTLKQQSNFCNPNDYFAVPQNFSLGSYGGYYTYTEMMAQIDAMAAQYPNLVKSRSTISDTLKTYNNNPLYWFKISDNPNTNEPEPKVLYTALHHAREPLSASQLIYLCWYLLENYNTNPDIKFLINNTELYFVPCVNPDGYMLNEQNDPLGGGMWRKNLEPNADGTTGTDLNRNYGYNWGYDDIGSSPTASSDVYRGSAPFSAAETRLMRLFCNQYTFKVALNAHSYGNLLIYPWGYNNGNTPDSLYFNRLAVQCTEHNRSIYGTAIETVNYNVNGTSDDWMYGEQSTKPKILAMTPESGTYYGGFYPPSADIIQLCQSYMLQNLRTAFSVHNYSYYKETSPTHLSNLTASTNLNFSYNALNINPTTPTQITIKDLSPSPTSVVSNQTFLPFVANNFVMTTPNNAWGCIDTMKIQVATNINPPNGYVFIDTLYKYVYDADSILFNDNFVNASKWQLEPTWSIAQGNLSDSRTGNNQTTGYPVARTINAIYLKPARKNRFYISFDAQWNLRRGKDDFVQVFIEDANGTRHPLCLTDAKPANVYQPVQAQAFSPVFDGVQSTYANQEADISNFVGQNVHIIFEIFTDGTGTSDGISIDNIKIKRTSNACPNVGTQPEPNTQQKIYIATQTGLQSVGFDGNGNNSRLLMYNALGSVVVDMKITDKQIVNINTTPGVYLYKIGNHKGKIMIQ